MEDLLSLPSAEHPIGVLAVGAWSPAYLRLGSLLECGAKIPAEVYEVRPAVALGTDLK